MFEIPNCSDIFNCHEISTMTDNDTDSIWIVTENGIQQFSNLHCKPSNFLRKKHSMKTLDLNKSECTKKEIRNYLAENLLMAAKIAPTKQGKKIFFEEFKISNLKKLFSI